MTEVKIASRTCPDEFGRPRTFHYSLTVDTVESNALSPAKTTASVSPRNRVIPLRSQGSPPALSESTS